MAQAANKSEAAAPANELVLAEGCFLPTYSWSQTLSDVSICVPLPANISAKMLDIVFQRQSIKVAIKGGQTILIGTLSATVYPDDCFWTLDKGCVEITLSKVTRPSRRTPFAPAWWRIALASNSSRRPIKNSSGAALSRATRILYPRKKRPSSTKTSIFQTSTPSPARTSTWWCAVTRAVPRPATFHLWV